MGTRAGAIERWRRDLANGGPLLRFERSYIPEPNSGCWLWVGTLFRTTGYAQFKGGLAHRWAYEHYKGPIEFGYEIDHLCRVLCCVNPYHLEAVTPKENCRRRDAALPPRQRSPINGRWIAC